MKMNPHEWGASLRQNGARICNPQRQRNPTDVADCKSAPGRIRVPSCPFVVEQSRFPTSVIARARPPPVPNVTTPLVTFVTIHKPAPNRLHNDRLKFGGEPGAVGWRENTRRRRPLGGLGRTTQVDEISQRAREYVLQ